MPASRNSLTSRSCSVPNARSIRPFACGLLAQIMSMFSSVTARAELRCPVAAGGILGIHPEDAVLVAVKGDWLAMCLEIGARRAEIIECRFRADKSQMHQSACRIVNKPQQRALLRAILKPRVFRTVDLYQLAKAIAPAAGLMRGGQTMATVDPQTRGDHPAAQRFT